MDMMGVQMTEITGGDVLKMAYNDFDEFEGEMLVITNGNWCKIDVEDRIAIYSYIREHYVVAD